MKPAHQGWVVRALRAWSLVAFAGFIAAGCGGGGGSPGTGTEQIASVPQPSAPAPSTGGGSFGH
jgi:hypothetical protein